MTEEQALHFLREELEREKGTPPANVILEANLTDDLEIDSIDLVELVMKLEDRFAIAIPDEVARKMKTVGDVVAFLSADSVATK